MGVLSISRTELLDMTPRELMCVYRGYQTRDRNDWEKVRVMAYYSAAPYASKGFNPSKIWTPYNDEQIKRNKPSTKKMLQREEIKQTYERSGFSISEKKLDEIMRLRENRI